MQAAFLGIVQGLTEFLPVSSSGHLVLFRNFLGLSEPALFFDISVHVGTMTAVILFFRKDLAAMASAIMGALGRRRPRIGGSRRDESGPGLTPCCGKDHGGSGHNGSGTHETRESIAAPGARAVPDARFALLIVVGTIPTACIGLLFHGVADRLFNSVALVGWMLIITGLLLWLTRRVGRDGNGRPFLTARDALVIGLVQGLAILPGISRSGSTISAGMFLGVARETAARYSFLLSIPAILGAEALALRDLALGAVTVNAAVLMGALTAAVTGYMALTLLLYVIRKGRLYLFAPYCWLVGVAALIAG